MLGNSKLRSSSKASAGPARSNGSIVSPCAISLARLSSMTRFQQGKARLRPVFASSRSVWPKRFRHGLLNEERAMGCLCKWKSNPPDLFAKKSDASFRAQRGISLFVDGNRRAIPRGVYPGPSILTSILKPSRKSLARVSAQARLEFLAMRRAPQLHPPQSILKSFRNRPTENPSPSAQ